MGGCPLVLHGPALFSPGSGKGHRAHMATQRHLGPCDSLVPPPSLSLPAAPHPGEGERTNGGEGMSRAGAPWSPGALPRAPHGLPCAPLRPSSLAPQRGGWPTGGGGGGVLATRAVGGEGPAPRSGQAKREGRRMDTAHPASSTPPLNPHPRTTHRGRRKEREGGRPPHQTTTSRQP